MSETIEEARTRIEPFRHQLLTSDLTVELKYKGLVLIAYEYVTTGWPEEAISVLFPVPQEYFSNIAPVQMRQDVEFFQRANAVLRAFRKIGVLPFQLEPIPQAVA